METVLLLFALAALALALVFIVREYKAGRKIEVLDSSLAARDRELAGLRQEVQRLSPFQAIIDARTELDALRAAAEASRAQTEASRDQILAQAQTTASRLVAEAQARVDQQSRQADTTARSLVTEARANAQQLSREAETDASHILAEAQARVDQQSRDAGAKASHLLAEAQARAERRYTDADTAASNLVTEARVRAEQLRIEAEATARGVTSEAQARAERLRVDADARLSHATREAARILEEARCKAEETAGEALQALHDSKRLEQTARAMKNIIEGYGDRYVMPTIGLLDELAESLSFAEAGQRLKAARERVRSMIKNGGAATCDYSEANRRSTAIDFVLDAFNGKVDMVLADVRHDNFGTLEQKIRDAFTLVNHNGRAFRNARILSEYLGARLDELKWAAVAQELKRKEREEQRALKERIREEERAQREYEKAQKEAEKEQETLRKAMEKARRDLETANRAERARYEQRLLDLTEKLRLAEEKNQRAKSMAQQTRSGHVYVISNIGSFGEDVVKIGMTRRLEPSERIRELGDASVPFEFDVHAMIPCEDAPALERALHSLFVRQQVNKVNPRKEFFRLTLRDIRAALERMKIVATWTLTAEAREFRETLALEQAMAKQDFDEAAWLKAQAQANAEMAAEQESIAELAVA